MAFDTGVLQVCNTKAVESLPYIFEDSGTEQHGGLSSWRQKQDDGIKSI